MIGIADAEFRQRIRKFQANIRAAGLDAAIVHANEADFAHVRYLSDYWPTFEAGGVFVPAAGKPVLIIGPESETYARGRSRIPDIEKMVEYRESAEPQYPGIAVASFRTSPQGDRHPQAGKLGLVGYSVMPLPVYMSLQRDLPGVELVKADDTLIDLRIVKSAAEIRLMRKAFQIGEKAIDAILGEIQPGMTELPGDRHCAARDLQARRRVRGPRALLLLRRVMGDEAAALASEAQGLPTLRLTEKQTADLDMIASGALSPLTGFMGQGDYDRVIDEMHLESGLPWAIPVTLSAPESPTADRLALEGHDGDLLAVIDVAEVYRADREREAAKVFPHHRGGPSRRGPDSTPRAPPSSGARSPCSSGPSRPSPSCTSTRPTRAPKSSIPDIDGR